MQTAIFVIWWIALIGALVLTVIASAEIVRIIHHAREINRLARVTLPAARGIADNTATLAALPGVLQDASRLLVAVETVDRTAAAIEGRAAALGRALNRE